MAAFRHQREEKVMIHVAVLGYGTVGSGVVEVIEKNKEQVNKKSCAELNVKYILDLRDFPGDPYEDKVVHDYEIILNDEEVSIICETMGGVRPAYDFTKKALQKGKRFGRCLRRPLMRCAPMRMWCLWKQMVPSNCH